MSFGGSMYFLILVAIGLYFAIGFILGDPSVMNWDPYWRFLLFVGCLAAWFCRGLAEISNKE